MGYPVSFKPLVKQKFIAIVLVFQQFKFLFNNAANLKTIFWRLYNWKPTCVRKPLNLGLN